MASYNNNPSLDHNVNDGNGSNDTSTGTTKGKKGKEDTRPKKLHDRFPTVNLKEGKEAVDSATCFQPKYYFEDGLRKVRPYTYEFRTHAKERWQGRELLEIFSTEFRDRSEAFYRWALSSGSVLVNNSPASPTYVLKNGDVIVNRTHRHEPPVTEHSVKILGKDDEKGILVVEKRGGVPVHSTGRYHYNTLLSILRHSNPSLPHPIRTANRLDRLTSGVMVCALTFEAAKKLSEKFGQNDEQRGREFGYWEAGDEDTGKGEQGGKRAKKKRMEREVVEKEEGRRRILERRKEQEGGRRSDDEVVDEGELEREVEREMEIRKATGRVKKEYVARVKGKFEDEEITCDEPLLCIDRQIGINVVHPDGKPSRTIFKKLSYHEATDTSVLKCRPITGRTHQIRVHLQFLGYPIANDPVYNNIAAWGPDRARGGLFRERMEEKTRAREMAPRSETSSPEATPVANDVAVVVGSPPSTKNGAKESSLDSEVPPPSEGGENAPVLAGSSTTEPTPKPAKGVKPSNLTAREWRLQKWEAKMTKRAAEIAKVDEMRSGSQGEVNDECKKAIKELRKVKDEDDQFSRWRDTDKLPVGDDEANGTTDKGNGKDNNEAVERDGRRTPEEEAKQKVEEVRKQAELVRGVMLEATNKTIRDDNDRKRAGSVGSEDGGNEGTVVEGSQASTSTNTNVDNVQDTSTTLSDDPNRPSILPLVRRYEGDYCPGCGVPLLPDPKPEQLYIWLHALRYWCDEWDYSSPLPDWAQDGENGERWKAPGWYLEQMEREKEEEMVEREKTETVDSKN